MRLHCKGSASARFAYPCHLLRLIAGWVVAVSAGVSMAAEVTVTLSNLTHTYNGSPKSVTVTTDPPGQACTVTYALSPNPPTTTAPTNAGSYAVVVTVDAPNTGPGATGTLVINQASQTITFDVTNKTYGNPPFNLGGTASSGLPVSYMSSNTAVVMISGSTATIMGAGSTTITASQPGNLNYLPATSVNRTQVIAKANQTIAMPALPAKTYGNAPFAVTASSTLPITKWESSDPYVATVSSTGLVTIVGAGQTAIIASNTGDTNYNSAFIGKPLNVARSTAPLPSGEQTVTYNGSAQGLDPAALPSGQASEITYRNVTVAEATPTPVVVFQNGPDTLALSYLSTGFWSSQIMGMAKYAGLAGTARKLHSCDVTLVSWARYDTTSPYGFKAWADANPTLVVPPTPGISIPGNSGGYYHPVTLGFYDYEIIDGSESYHLLTSKTVQAFIPWRPERSANNVTVYPNSGYAFRVLFEFPDGVILPDNVWVSVSFNTSAFGTAPIGTSGPYDALNVSYTAGTGDGDIVGTTQFSTTTQSTILTHQDWRWGASTVAIGSTRGPMLRLKAVPTNTSLTKPVNAGTYAVKTQAAAFSADGSTSSTLVIGKAPLAVNLTNLTQVRDGSPKPVTVSTTPAGFPTSVTYAGSSNAPSALGSYPVTATATNLTNPNYEDTGQANGTLRIGDNYASWRNATFASSGLPPEQITDTADPDGDGLRNFLEYASNFNPLLGNPSPMGLEQGGATMSFTYRRNLHALDLDYRIEGSSQLGNPLSWSQVTPLGEIPLSDDGATRVIQATVAKPADVPSYFLRLKVAPP